MQAVLDLVGNWNIDPARPGPVRGSGHGKSLPAHRALAQRKDNQQSDNQLMDNQQMDNPRPRFHLAVAVDDLEIGDFHSLAERIAAARVEFVIPPHLRFAGAPGEQWTMFCYDPAGNALEFTAFADDAEVFRPE